MSSNNLATNHEPAVRLRGVTKKAGKRTLVDSLTLDIRKGEVLGLLGPNGAGKTTTIRMIAGLISMNGGQILVEGIDVKKQGPQARRNIGAIVENPEMYKFLTGYQNLVHYARMVPGVTSERIQEMVEVVGLSGRIHHKVKTYSLGMRQRLGVAQALLHKPSVLILDEPTNGLDPAGIRELRDYLKRLAHEEGVAVVVSSHLLSEMELMCDRIAIIQHGKLIDVQHVRDAQAVSAFRFEVSNVAAAAASLAQETDFSIVTGPDYVEIQAEREAVPSINRILVLANIDIYRITSQARSLEERFLAMTQEEQR